MKKALLILVFVIMAIGVNATEWSRPISYIYNYNNYTNVTTNDPNIVWINATPMNNTIRYIIGLNENIYINQSALWNASFNASGDVRYYLASNQNQFINYSSLYNTTFNNSGNALVSANLWTAEFNSTGDTGWLPKEGGTLTGTLTSQTISPSADDTYDLGGANEFKDLYIDGTAYIDALNMDGNADFDQNDILDISDINVGDYITLNEIDNGGNTAYIWAAADSGKVWICGTSQTSNCLEVYNGGMWMQGTNAVIGWGAKDGTLSQTGGSLYSIKPNAHKGQFLGLANPSWDTVYGDDFTNTGPLDFSDNPKYSDSNALDFMRTNEIKGKEINTKDINNQKNDFSEVGLYAQEVDVSTLPLEVTDYYNLVTTNARCKVNSTKSKEQCDKDFPVVDMSNSSQRDVVGVSLGNWISFTYTALQQEIKDKDTKIDDLQQQIDLLYADNEAFRQENALLKEAICEINKGAKICQ